MGRKLFNPDWYSEADPIVCDENPKFREPEIQVSSDHEIEFEGTQLDKARPYHTHRQAEVFKNPISHAEFRERVVWEVGKRADPNDPPAIFCDCKLTESEKSDIDELGASLGD